MTSLCRYLFYRICHVVDGNHKKAIGDFNCRTFVASCFINFESQGPKLFIYYISIQALVTVRTEYWREKLCLDFADHGVGIGYR